MTFSEMLKLPVVGSSHGQDVDMVIILVHLLMFALLVGWGIFFLFTLVRFNRRVNPKASYQGVNSHISSYLEVAVVMLEALLLIGFSIPFWAKQVNAFPQRKDIVEVRVVAEQFAWNIHYPGEDGIFGSARPELVDTQTNPLGLDPDDPNGKDDFTTINQLHLPIGKPAIIYLSSKDVIHSFALPIMRVKQDAIPGLVIPTWFTPTKSGTSEIACAQLCGIGHYRMRGQLIVHHQEEYDAWVARNAPVIGEEGAEEYDDFWN